MKTHLLLASFLAVSFIAPAQTIETFTPQKELRAKVTREKMADASVIKKTIRAGLMELELIRSAGTNSSSMELQKLAIQLASDAEDLNQRLGDIALAAGIEVPTLPSKMMRDRAEAVSRLSGAEFDLAFLQAISASRQGTIGIFEMTSTGTRNHALQELAGEVLPSLKATSLEIEQLSGRIGQVHGEMEEPAVQ